MAVNREDSDIKIADGKFGKSDDFFDAVEFIEETKKQRFNGNNAKARALGANIVSSFSYSAAPDELLALAEEFGVEITPEVLLQIKILSVFTAEVCLNSMLPSAMLSGVAINALYDVLDRVSPEFYSVMYNSTAFSFYYMCLKNGDDVAGSIGRRFAMLCGDRDSRPLAFFGKKLYEVNTAVYTKAISGVAFV